MMRWTTGLEILSLAFQAVIAVAQATAMFAMATGQAENGVRAAMMCHAPGPDGSSRVDALPNNKRSAPAAAQNCACCLGLVGTTLDTANFSDWTVAKLSPNRVVPIPTVVASNCGHRLAS